MLDLSLVDCSKSSSFDCHKSFFLLFLRKATKPLLMPLCYFRAQNVTVGIRLHSSRDVVMHVPVSLNDLFSDCNLINFILSDNMAALNSDLAGPGPGGRPMNPQANPFGSALNGAAPGLICTGLGVYGERFLDSSSEFMQSNVSFHKDLFGDWYDSNYRS
jgi:hypothetical protein